MTGTTSRKLDLIRKAGRLSLMVERVSPSIRYVSVSGEVERLEDTTREDLVEMASRYLEPEQVGPYVDFAISDHGAQTKVFVRPQQWVAADLGTL